MRWVIVVVLPVPAPARIATGPRTTVTASRWASFSPARISSGARIRRPNSDTEADPSTGPRLQMDPARSCASPSRPPRVPAKQSPPDEERQAADDEGCDGLGSTTKPTAPEGFPGQQDAGEQSKPSLEDPYRGDRDAEQA